MGAFLDTPKTEKETERFENERLKCGVSCMQGWRIEMEDAHTVVLDIKTHPGLSYFGVYDGHGGSLVAKHTAEHILPTIAAQEEFKSPKAEPDNLTAAITKGFLQLDAEMRELPQVVAGVDHSGSTAITAFVTPTHYVIGNCGDSRAVLSRGAGKELWASEDHKPYNDEERKRIENAGGTVSMRRVNGDLAVSRALGDYLYKHVAGLDARRQQVSCEPTCTVLKREADDDYLILACDGIWDVMSNADCAAFVRSMVLAGETDLGAVCEGLLDHCLALNSRDNMSACIIQLPGAVMPSEKKVQQYQQDKAARKEKERLAREGESKA